MRVDALHSDLRLPPCPIPREGDEVVWYRSGQQRHGRLVGYSANAHPIVSEGGPESTLDSIHMLRRKDPLKARGPAWTRLPDSAVLVRANADEATRLKELLEQILPPGPRASQLIEEVWSRGFEVFLVGGTVRDVVAGQAPNDIDLVTTMPLELMMSLLDAMFQVLPSDDRKRRAMITNLRKNGYVRCGRCGPGDPFIDLKMFAAVRYTSSDAIFGTELLPDVQHRDFACNAIYYDPINEVFIDPSGQGIRDAEMRRLSLVAATPHKAPVDRGKICIRAFKFMARGYELSDGSARAITDDYVPNLAAMATPVRIQYIRSQVLGKCATHERDDLWRRFYGAFETLHAHQAWNQYVSPIEKDILA